MCVLVVSVDRDPKKKEKKVQYKDGNHFDQPVC